MNAWNVGCGNDEVGGALERGRRVGFGRLGAVFLTSALAMALASAGCGGKTSCTRCQTNNGGCGDPGFVSCVDQCGAAPTCVAVKPEPTGLSSDAPPYAVHGASWVGFREFEVGGGDPTAPLKIKAWYPALNPTGAREEITYPLTLKLAQAMGITVDHPTVNGHAILDAPLDGSKGRLPLVVFSHGYLLSPEMYSALLEHYASEGFVVLAPEHSETDWMQAWAASIDRLRDLHRTLDFAEAATGSGGQLAGMLDTSKTAVVGHSYGGYAALAMAGAQFDLATFNARCAALAPEDPKNFLCAPFLGKEQDMATRAGLNAVPAGLWPAMGDPRVVAIVDLAGDAFLFNNGLATIQIPMMGIGGTADTQAPWAWGAKLAYEGVTSAHKALVGFQNGEHMLSLDSCEAMPWTDVLRPIGYYGAFCSDPAWHKLHALDLINHFSTAFLLDVLTGDAAAHQALSPETVFFPGVEYTVKLQ